MYLCHVFKKRLLKKMLGLLQLFRLSADCSIVKIVRKATQNGFAQP
ncbi:hypothetical protein M23134_03001 [Microscilla marina ATCC 23134]|uniref:Uncharacterized protein n=1 Tax=Microscilla marina ATCC 23134 TaxID=313606 RepID=A1ZY40_MICM2|nr:hypothetical protein M23134_03001 [Microscilla marina ATCC 23134]